MRISILKGLIGGFFFVSTALVAQSQNPVITLEDVPDDLQTITPDEPIAAEFSPAKAAQYLDQASLTWQKKKKCATCHTNMSYMMARPALSSFQKDSGEVRAFYEAYPNEHWKKKPPSEKQGFWTIVVGTGLTFNDLQTTGKLSDVTREALDLIWTVQREDGGWRWPHCDYAPLEIDDHFGVTLAALTIGIAPDNYAETPAAKAGLEKLRGYLKNDPPKSLHHRAMLAWCSIRVDGIATDAERAKALEELMALQLPDGGWSTASFLTDWRGGIKREDGKPLDVKTSDGYGTGFVTIIAREMEVPANDPRLQKSVAWLKSNQREGGKWFTKSPVNHARNLISNIGSAYAVLALQACGELGETSPLGK
ncbi:hypothetical protein OAL00_03920 [Verrucomicrobiales bacterium]|nr:hypothetical protein [Verrucomicrobiales bacterium]